MSEFDLAELISAPIIAMNESESENAIRFVELLQEYALDAPDKDGNQTLRKLSFAFEKFEPDGTLSMQNIEIPLVQFMPIGGVTIESAKLNYALKLNSAANKNGKKMRMIGQLAEAVKSETPLSGNLDIELHLKQIDMPQGVLSMLQLSQAAVIERSAPIQTIIEIPDDFIDLDLADLDPKVVSAGQDVISVINVDFEKLNSHPNTKVELKFSASPKSALVFEKMNSMMVDKSQKIEVPFLVAPSVEKYKSTSKIKLNVEAKVTDSDGKTKIIKKEFLVPRENTKIK